MKEFVFGLILFVLFLWRFNAGVQANQNLDKFSGQSIFLTGKISSNISLQGDYQSFNIGRVRVRTTLYPAYHYGDTLKLSGTLKKQVINRYYSRFSLLYPQIEKLKSGNSIFIGLKESLESWYSRVLPEPEASLMAGIVLGSKKGLPPDFYLELKKTGTMHIVVASGYNVNVVLGAIIFLLAGILPRLWAVGLGLAAVAVYSFIAGLEAPIVRAAIMGSLACFGRVFGRQITAVRLLFLAAAAMIAINPLYLFDVGFQLSFLATLGLILLGRRLPESLAAFIFVWPVLFLNFGYVSWIGILVNILIVFFVPYVMYLFAFPWLAYVPLHLMVIIINFFAQIS